MVISLTAIPYKLFEQNIELHVVAKLWRFGAVSISLKIPIDDPIQSNAFKDFARFVENDPALETITKNCLSELLIDLRPAVKSEAIWDQLEDYIIYVLDPSILRGGDFSQILASESLYDLILTETQLTLSTQVKDLIRQSSIQYSTQDIAIIDWNSALVCSEDDAHDICDVIEFGLTQLLELRYYDHLLDTKLTGLYKEIQSKRENIFLSRYAKFSKESAFLYIEISDIIEKIENSLKFIGDIYYARIFRLATERLRLKEWSYSIDTKLKNLADISSLFKDDVTERRSHLLELIIIILIAIEVVPFLTKSMMN
jgi:hypothetical protein